MSKQIGLIRVDVPESCDACKFSVYEEFKHYKCELIRLKSIFFEGKKSRSPDCPIVPLPDGGLKFIISELNRASNEIKNNRDSFTDLKTCALIESLYEALKGLISE